MSQIIAICGLQCDQCEAYQATQANDETWKERVAAQWRRDYNNPTFTAANVACDGCIAKTDRLCSHCLECGIRLCGLEHGVANCGACPEYEACQRIQDFFKYVPNARVVLDAYRADQASAG